MNKEEARQFKARWQMVNDFTNRETREATLTSKLEQLTTMYEAAQALGWADGLRAGEEEVRERWRRLREFYRAGA
jgi:flagellar biosynthesis/type III secretory pathway protein FliH